MEAPEPDVLAHLEQKPLVPAKPRPSRVVDDRIITLSSFMTYDVKPCAEYAKKAPKPKETEKFDEDKEVEETIAQA